MRLERIAWYDVPTYWPAVEGWVLDALSHGNGGYGQADVIQGLMAKHMHMFLVMDGETPRAVWIVRLASLPRFMVCELFIVAGSGLENWEDLISTLEDWARSMGCGAMDSQGRLGWRAAARRQGYQVSHVTYRKVLGSKPNGHGIDENERTGDADRGPGSMEAATAVHHAGV